MLHAAVYIYLIPDQERGGSGQVTRRYRRGRFFWVGCLIPVRSLPPRSGNCAPIEFAHRTGLPQDCHFGEGNNKKTEKQDKTRKQGDWATATDALHSRREICTSQTRRHVQRYRARVSVASMQSRPPVGMGINLPEHAHAHTPFHQKKVPKAVSTFSNFNFESYFQL